MSGDPTGVHRGGRGICFSFFGVFGPCIGGDLEVARGRKASGRPHEGHANNDRHRGAFIARYRHLWIRLQVGKQGIV